MKDLGVWHMTTIVFVAQIVFLYLRSLNIKHVASDKMWKAILTGNGIAICWMIGIAIGANAMMEGHIAPIIAHLAGGTIGTYLAMYRKHYARIEEEKAVHTLNARLHRENPNAKVGSTVWCSAINGKAKLDENNNWVRIS